MYAKIVKKRKEKLDFYCKKCTVLSWLIFWQLFCLNKGGDYDRLGGDSDFRRVGQTIAGYRGRRFSFSAAERSTLIQVRTTIVTTITVITVRVRQIEVLVGAYAQTVISQVVVDPSQTFTLPPSAG